MLTIRLSRVGKKKQAEYRVIISEKHKDPWGDVLEFLGYYNPRVEPAQADLKVDRIKYWLSQGAQMSGTVKNLFIEQKIIEGKKVKPIGIKKMKKKDLKSGGDKEEKAAEGDKSVPVEAEKTEDKKSDEKQQDKSEEKTEVKEEKHEVKTEPAIEEKPKKASKEDKKE